MHQHDEETAQFERVPPHNTTAEQATLGGMMSSKTAILDAIDTINGPDFYRPAHETIFGSILTLYTLGEPTDPITVAAQLRKDGNLERIGGPPYLHTCIMAIPTAANTGYYAEIVRDLALLRRVIETGTGLVQLGYEARATPEQAAEVLDAAAAQLQALTAGAAARGESREWLLDRIIEDVLTDYDHPSGDNLPLPWKDLEEKAPMEQGDFVVVAARPAMGKTLVLLEIARHVAIRHGRGALIASMEMSHRQMGQRVLVAEANVSLSRFRARELDPNEREAVDTAAGRILEEAAGGTVTERAVVELVLRAGLRGSEVEACARRHFTPTLGRPTLLAGTKYRPRTITLAPSVAGAVGALLREREADINAPLVHGLSSVALVQLVRAVCRRAGVDVGVHDLRRTAIATVLDAGVAMLDVQGYFGFSVSGTAPVGVRPGRDVEIARVLERAFTAG